MQKYLSRVLFVLCLLSTQPVFSQFTKNYSDQPALKSAAWVRDAVIYCVYLRSFSPEGTFDALRQRIPELKELGATVIWLMPIHPVGLKNRKGTLGSPYSVRDYYDVNPEFGTMLDFQKLVDAVHQNGMKIIIDLVINHTAWDSKLIKQHPEWFTHDSTGKIVSPNDDWTDVADLDYSKRGLREYMINMMQYWVNDIGIDGFRCDVSELVPLDFWEEARARLNRIKPVMMLSEGSLPDQHLKAFDITYSWNVYDVLDPLLNGKKPASYIDTLLRQEATRFPKGSLRLRFNTNHDKNAWDAPAITKYGEDGLKLTAVLINTIPGVPLIYNGEEIANDKALSLFEKVDIDWTRPRTMDTLYHTLFKLRKEHKALVSSDMVTVPTSNPMDVYAFMRTSGIDRVLTILNFSKEEQRVTFTPPQRWTGREAFTDESMKFDSSKPFELTLEPRGYKVFLSK